MKIAQQLFENGFITYHRTDSPRLSTEAVQKIRKLIQVKCGEEYLPERAIEYKAKESAQDAHEAIRPVLLDLTGSSEKLRNKLNSAQWQLYSLIWRRTIMSQMKPAEWDYQKVVFENEEGVKFYAKGKVLIFEGWRKMQKSERLEEGLLEELLQDKQENQQEDEQEEKNMILPHLEKGEILRGNVSLKQKETRPPQRYSEATIVKWMEKTGVGRPSTYASTVKILKTRGYVEVKDRKLYPTSLGYEVWQYLRERYSWMICADFTAEIEKQLDLIEQGKLDWKVPVLEVLKRLSG
jgi:DNA topoisomerase-1